MAAAAASGTDWLWRACVEGRNDSRQGPSGCLEPYPFVSGLVCVLPVGSLCSPWLQPLYPSGWLFLLGCFISEPLQSRTQLCLSQKSQLGQGMESGMPFLMGFLVSLGILCSVLLSLRAGLEPPD